MGCYHPIMLLLDALGTRSSDLPMRLSDYRSSVIVQLIIIPEIGNWRLVSGPFTFIGLNENFIAPKWILNRPPGILFVLHSKRVQEFHFTRFGLSMDLLVNTHTESPGYSLQRLVSIRGGLVWS
ncbi:hypothetical protein KQX54_018511 [Cotesia glomerata]|uniref:Uncharacterized protein n=1 Tax=Cotesia glomerata TaxID=32391 RepID=A0AAV7HZB6_COTGL|nr:hypothetical protein KQX54_018511 [Cotesia glomerata]